MDKVDINGSCLEGGGQILRTAIGISAVTGRPCRIFNIRAGRPSPGLKAQHLKGIEAVAKLCNAELKGVKIGSTEIEFAPKEIKTHHLKIDIGTAGSVTLVLQALTIPAIHAQEPLEFEITGGTHVSWSPTTGYFRHVFCEYMKMIGVLITSETISYGYYPKGGGRIKARVEPVKELKPVLLEERGKHIATEAWSNASSELMKADVAERQLTGANKILKLDRKNVKYVSSLSAGSSIIIVSRFENCFLGASSLGERGKPAEKVGEEAARELQKVLESPATADKRMTDQILPYLALAYGKSSIIAPELTNHAKTNIWVIEKFLGKRFSTEEISGGVKISCSREKYQKTTVRF